MMFLLFVTNILSRLMGAFAKISWFFPLNILFVGGFKSLVGIRLHDAEHKSLSHYKSILQLFTRSLADGERPMQSDIVSPCDGKVYDFGRIEANRTFLVKGHRYDLNDLLTVEDQNLSDGYFASIYLSPKDCHQYFMPCDAVITEVVHIPGPNLPVHPLVMKVLPAIYQLNERVLVTFTYQEQRCYMLMVSALNVGKMTIDCVPELQTNAKLGQKRQSYSVNHRIKKGDKVGQFELGSTIVLFFPKAFNLDSTFKQEFVLRYGESIYNHI